VNDDLQRTVDNLVAPLATIAPASRARGRRVLRRRWLPIMAAATILATVAAGATWATVELTESPTPSPTSPGGSLNCLDLVGGTAANAEAVLADRGYTIDWRLITHEPPNGTSAKSTAAKSVPDSAIVERVFSESPGAVFVFVHLADDPYAKPPIAPPCVAP
jgi:hypothetical protein